MSTFAALTSQDSVHTGQRLNTCELLPLAMADALQSAVAKPHLTEEWDEQEELNIWYRS